MKELSNEDLLKAYAQGEFKAFDIFYKRNSKIIFLFILSRLKNQPLADDIFQETFFRIHKYIHRFDPSKNALNWVFTIARNRITTYFQSQTTLEILDENTVSNTSSQIQVEARDELEKTLKNLAPEDQQILVDRFFHEDSFEEMAKKNKSTAVSLRKKVSRLLKKIRSTQYF